MDLLSNEEVFEVISHLNIIDRISLSKTSTRHKALVEAAALPTVLNLLKRFTPKPSDLLRLIWSNSAVIGGPIAYTSLFPTEEPKEGNKLHIFVPASTQRSFLEALKTEFHFQFTDYQQIKTKHFIQHSIKKVLRLQNTQKATITIYYSTEDSALFPIFHLSSTHDMNFISAYGIYCAYPLFTLHKRTIIHPKAISKHRHDGEMQRVIDQYTSYGLQVHQSFQDLPHSQPKHLCRTDIQCPHLIRSLYDKHGLFIQFKYDITQTFLSNKIAYNETGVVWSLGGEECDIDMIVNEAFVKTTWLNNGKFNVITIFYQRLIITIKKNNINIVGPSRFQTLEEESDHTGDESI